jgi:hypothetical protein
MMYFRGWLAVTRVLSMMVLLGVMVLAVPAQDQAKAQKAAPKKTAASSVFTAQKGVDLGAGVFAGIAADMPQGGRLILRDPPAPKPEDFSKINPKKLTPAQKQILQKAREQAIALQKMPRKETEFVVGDSVPIHFKVLPQPYDDKGNIITPTREEKEKLKGAGIDGKLEQIRSGHIVRVEQTGEKGYAKVKSVTVVGEANLPNEPVKPTPPNKKK